MPEKQPFWRRFFGIEPQTFICPYCHYQIEKNMPYCTTCGVHLKTQYKGSKRERVWTSNLPEILDCIVPSYVKSGVNYEKKSLSDALADWNLSLETVDELCSTMPVKIPISPSALLAVLLEEYYSLLRSEFHIARKLTLEQMLRFVVRKIPAEVKNFAEVKDAIIKLFYFWVDDVAEHPISSREYNQYLIDCHCGGGWLPPFDYSVTVEPFGHEITDNGRFAAFVHNLRYDEFLRHQTNALAIASDNLCCFNLALSNRDSITPTQMEHFWSSLQGIKNPVIFELIGSGKDQQIIVQILCHPNDKAPIAPQLLALFPHSSINPEGNDHDYLINQIGDNYRAKFASDFQACGSVFGLGRHYSYPLRTFSSFDKTDPLSPVLNPLSELESSEGVVVQALISPSKGGWDKQLKWIGELSKSDRYNYSGFKGCSVHKKLNYPLFSVVFRVMAFCRQESSNLAKLKALPLTILRSFAPFSSPEGNSISNQLLESNPFNPQRAKLSQLPKLYHQVKSELNDKELLGVLERNSYRHGFILNSQELASLVHFPSKSLQHPKLLRQESARAKAPAATTAGDGLLIGINEVFGQSQEVYVPEHFRFRHIYVVGKSGTGKSTLLLNMLTGDIYAGKGVGLIDPHGDLVEKVLQVIPDNRIDDVILFDPADYDYPIGFNMLQVGDLKERRQIRSDIVVAIRRLFEASSWGDNIDQLFRVSIATLLDDIEPNHTLLDVRRLISDDVFRSQVIGRISDEYLKEFWTDDFPSFTQSTVSAVKRRLASILNEPAVRNVLAQSHTSFNFKEMMDTKKIFLANLSRGNLGEDISSLFGGLLVSKIQLTAMARAAQLEEERVPFYLYVDEFQNFVNESFEIILSEARKYKLCLTIAHQFTGQLPSRLYNAVFGNVGTLISFEVGVDDANALEKQLGQFSQDDIINLERFHTFTRIGKAKDSFSMRTLPPPEIDKDNTERIRQASRDKYCLKDADKKTPSEQAYSTPTPEFLAASEQQPEVEKEIKLEPVEPKDKDKDEQEDKPELQFFEE